MNIIEKWSQYPSIKRFEKLLRRGRITPKTVEDYTKSVKRLCDILGHKDPENALDVIRKIENREVYFDELIETLRDKGRSNSAIVNMYKGVKSWLWLNKVDVDWRDVILPSIERQVEDRAPTKEELRRIINVSNLRDKALILTAISSGMRRNTLLTLKVGDVNFEYPDVARIVVKRQYEVEGKKFKSGRKISKKRNFYATFITPEARKTLEEYIEQRKRLGEDVNENSPLFTSIRHADLGTFLNANYLSLHWGRLLKKAGLTTKSGKWHVIHLHTLKKFAETQFINAGIKPSYREFWLGHKGAYLESNYFRGEESEHLKEYRKALPNLSIEKVVVSEESVDMALAMLATQMRGKSESEKIDMLLHFTQQLPSSTRDRVVAKIEEEPQLLGVSMKRVLEVMRKETEAKEQEEDCQKVIEEKELQAHLAKGYHFVATLPSGKILVED